MPTVMQTITTFKANVDKAVFDRETVTIGGGEFNPAELEQISIVLGMVPKLIGLLAEQHNAASKAAELARTAIGAASIEVPKRKT